MTRLKLLFAFLFIVSCTDDNTLILKNKTSEHQIQIEIARTLDEMRTGLMFRKSMDENAGMLFDYQTERPVTMWMKNTYIPLDMLFIKKDGTIHRIERNTTPHSEKRIPSGSPVAAVLELNAGTANRLNISAGDTVIHSIFKN